jgi:hypothetical protein
VGEPDGRHDVHPRACRDVHDRLGCRVDHQSVHRYERHHFESPNRTTSTTIDHRTGRSIVRMDGGSHLGAVDGKTSRKTWLTMLRDRS